MLVINNLKVSVNEKPILDSIRLSVGKGEIHAIMGPNGSGKSTLAKVIVGHPLCKVTEGSMEYNINGQRINLLPLSPEERAREGIFLAFQYPMEIPGVSNAVFLRAAYNEILKKTGREEMDPMDFNIFIKQKMKELDLDESFINRFVNVDFSGGEKKRNEILQMAVLSPRLVFLDEVDSGLDVDSLRTVADRINRLKTKDNALVLVTHYQRILNYVVPDYVHVLSNGRIIKTGGKDLALYIEENGYDTIKEEKKRV
ncbi:MAG: Fe-S cluster assembly ATPase SufC [Candidatus Aureabacteria bacterium]|nr:Fe-S cluster assembly ATPase SufC [Candidatus Auribacterota bacterium]